MRRRLVVSTIAIVLVVLAAIALPIGLLVYDAAERQLDARIDDQAATIGAILSEAGAEGRAPSLASIQDILGPNDGVQLTDPDGEVLLSVTVPAGSRRSSTITAADGVEVVVSTSAEPLDENFRTQLQLLGVLALGALAAAAGLAAVQGHQLARPLERLSKRAGVLGDGDFSLGAFQKTQIPEIDAIGTSLETSAQRVETLLANERHFTADATHQLRTGIAGIAMRVEILTMAHDEEVVEEAREILHQTDQLNHTIDDLLAAARNRTMSERQVFDLADLVAAHVDEWKPRFDAARRHIGLVSTSPFLKVYGTKGLAGQVIDILVDNSLRHGAGAVTLLVEGAGVTIIDQGPGVNPSRLKHLFDGPVDPSARHGRGLSLARRLAQVDGATLEVVGNHPLRLRLRLPLSDAVAPTGDD